MIHLDRNLIMNCQILMYVTYNLSIFSSIFNEVFNKHAPMRKTFLRANQGVFMTKELNKAIMNRSRFRNKYLKEKSADSEITYDK